MNDENIKAKKRFGQNFLNNDEILNKIVNIFSIENEKIIEIGPGTGNLTNKLLEKNNSVTAFEIDSDLVEYLQEKITSEKFDLIEKNFLDVDLEPYKGHWIIANIPYYITSEIIFKILEKKQNFHGIVIMVQKEVAERICSDIKSPNYSKLTVTCNYYADVKLEFIVDRKNFSPVPKVDSAVVSFKFKPEIDYNKHINNFFKLCFLHRRKKLLHSLKEKYEKNSIISAFETLEINENIRIQHLNIEKIMMLYKLLNKD